MAGFVVRKITFFSIFFNQQTIALVTLNNVLECCHFFIHVRCIHTFFYFRIDVQSSVQFSEYAKSSNLGGVLHPPNTPLPTALRLLIVTVACQTRIDLSLDISSYFMLTLVVFETSRQQYTIEIKMISFPCR